MKESERNEFPFYPPFQFNFVFFCVCDNGTCIFAQNPCEREKNATYATRFMINSFINVSELTPTHPHKNLN